MKLSFSLSTKPSSKQQQQPSLIKPSQNFNSEDHQESASAIIINNREYVTEFDPSQTLANAQSKKKLVIPPKPNEWRPPPHKKMKNLDLPVASDCPNLQFETESPTFVAEAALDSNMSFGLNLRESTKTDDANNVESNDRLRPASIDSVMLQKLKDDLKRLPDDRGFEEFTDVPVEGFGAALLAGYGWVEGRGIGRNAKEDVKVKQYERRTAKEGLGFVSDMINNTSVSSNNGVKKKEKDQNSRREEKHWYYVGKDVRIVGGRDLGLKGRIVKIVGDGDPVVLKISKTDEEVTVRVCDIADLGSVEEERCLKKLKELKIRGSNDKVGSSDGGRVKDSHSSRSHKESRGDKRKDSKSNREEGRRSDRREEERSSRISWLTSHIRVRVVSKELKRGRLYLKKGEILDVVGPTTCDISIDESRELIQGVDQDLLETALPRRGGPVLVLYGKNKGVYGNLVERDMENETGVVRDADTHALLNVRLEQIAEYVGDPSYIGY